VLDAWRRSGLPAGDFGPLVGLSKHTLYDWKRRFEAEGPAGLADKPRGSPRGSRMPEVTKRAILMMKQDNPDWGCERISALLLRGPALPASPQAVARVLHDAGYETEDAPTRARTASDAHRRSYSYISPPTSPAQTPPPHGILGVRPNARNAEAPHVDPSIPRRPRADAQPPSRSARPAFVAAGLLRQRCPTMPFS
jgi:transposase